MHHALRDGTAGDQDSIAHLFKNLHLTRPDQTRPHYYDTQLQTRLIGLACKEGTSVGLYVCVDQPSQSFERMSRFKNASFKTQSSVVGSTTGGSYRVANSGSAGHQHDIDRFDPDREQRA